MKNWIKSRWGIASICALAIILVACFLAVYFVPLRGGLSTGSDAFSTANASSYVSVGELLVDANSATGDMPFSENVATLVNMIYGVAGDASVQVAALAATLAESPTATTPKALSAATLRAKTYNKDAGKSIVVRLGGLDWIVTYVSTDTSGDLVATLWLSDNHQSAWSGRNESLGTHYGLVSGGLYSDFADDWHNTGYSTFPSSMYGTSYIRVETLNNPTARQYAGGYSDATLTSGTTQSTSHIFSLYTCASKGLTQYLDTPNQMKWLKNRQNPANRKQDDYWLSNESLSSENVYGYTASTGWNSTSMNFETLEGYDSWESDYLWLPSAAEIGYTADYDGFWEISTAERSLYDSTTMSIDSTYIGTDQAYNTGVAYALTWTRSQYFSNARDLYAVYPSGESVDTGYASASAAVRPCLLLNLSAVVADSAPADDRVDELLIDSSSATAATPFNSATLTELVNMIYGASGDMATQVASLTTSTATTPLTAATLRSKTYNKAAGKSIVVRLGGLDWIVTYVSRDTSGNLIATLWLSNNHQEAWSGRNESLGEHYGLVQGGLYSDFSADWHATNYTKYPGTMYGTSYIRTETLNNPYNRKYAASYSVTSLTSGTAQATTTDSHIFALYTAPSLGLTEYLATPNQMSWINNRQNPANRNQSTYWLNNESLSSTNSGNYTASSGWSSSGMNFENIEGYSSWGSDYLWLPSAAEIGSNADTDGFWEINSLERNTYDGTSSSITSSTIGTDQYYNAGVAYAFTWTRSASYDSTRNAYAMESSGAGVGTGFISASAAVRPAMLFNLTAASQHSGEPCTITLNKALGTGGDTIILGARGDTLPTITPPTRSGYGFKGYYTAANGQGTQVYDVGGRPVSSTQTFTQDTTLYALWGDVVSCQVAVASSISGVAGVLTGAGTYSQGTSATLVAYPVVGYSFYYWLRDGEPFAGNSQNSISVVVYESCSYTAVFGSASVEGDQFFVSSTKGGVAYVVGHSADNLGDEDSVIYSTDLTLTGYEFVGWYLDDDRTECFSTDMSIKVSKSVASQHVFVAVYRTVTFDDVNTDIDNSNS